MSEDTLKNHPGAIRSITLENFRGIEKLSLSFLEPNDQPSPIVVLGGPNGSGKTTVLEACLIAAQHGELIRGAQGSAAVRSGARGSQIVAEFDTPTGRVRTVHQEGFPIRASVVRESMQIPCAYFSSWRAPKLIGPLSITAGKRGKRPLESEENRLGFIKQYLVNAKAHESMSYASKIPPELDAQSEYKRAIRRLNNAWQDFHRGESQWFSVEPVSDNPDAGFDVYLTGPAGGQRVALDFLSSGEIELINFFGWMIISKFEAGIVFIDEPELHLDPQWHGVIMRALQKVLPNSQFVVATHSPELYDSVMSFQRHFLISDDDPRAKAWGLRAKKGIEV